MSLLCAQINEVEKSLQEPEKLGSETEVYSRISGYYRSIKNWNPGKRSEERERVAYAV
jgi:ribonucleoside-triphosphate reductase